MAQRSHNPLDLAINEIRSTYGHLASFYESGRSLHKWGYLPSSAATTWETVKYSGGNETLLETNAITVIDTTNAGDAGKEIYVEGHYLNGTDLVFHAQTVTLTGLTAVTLAQPLARCSRMRINSGTAVAAGNITANAGEGGTAYNLIAAGDTQTEKAQTTVSFQEYFVVTSFGSSILGNNNAAARFRAEMKSSGRPWVPQARWSLKGDTTDYVRLTGDNPFIIPPNSDIRIRVNCSTAGTAVDAWFDGYMAIIE